MASRASRPPRDLSQIALKVRNEFVGSALTILSIYLLRRLVELLLGNDVLWGFLPIRYCQDTVDAAVFLKFIWEVFQ
jgi:hypothetical protein